MEISADDNFFIEEPQKLRNSFFNSDKSMQMVELLTAKHSNSNSSIIHCAKNSDDDDDCGNDDDEDVDDDDLSSGSPISGSSTTADKKSHRRQLNNKQDSHSRSTPTKQLIDDRIQPCRLTTYYKKLKQLHQQHAQLQNQLHQQHQNNQLTQEQKEELLSQYQKQTQLQQQSQTLPLSSQQQQQLLAKMPRSIIARLDLLCQVIHSHATSNISTGNNNLTTATTTTTATSDFGDLNLVQQTVETLVNASKSGCCFLERYIVMIMNVCTRNLIDSDQHSDNEPMRLKVMELLNKVLYVKFDRQQLIENFRKPEHKLSSIEQMIQLMRIIQATLDYREQVAVDWLTVILDAYFVEMATSDEAVEIIDQISAHIDFQCALLRETESSKCLLDSIIEQLNAQDKVELLHRNQSVGRWSRATQRLRVGGTKRNKRPRFDESQLQI